ncbi:hypothetical protein L1987_54856 [Smallanthus sonchifolius]|uniref:Uncharacterized protein n=1 Tax=Smallanthus sonchifolius TaxID=185202 RepID=A0ACB9E7S8_9ASTR|nr:hypothetical protein L1987_54856 [Smallanthus sonchifolius]
MQRTTSFTNRPCKGCRASKTTSAKNDEFHGSSAPRTPGFRKSPTPRTVGFINHPRQEWRSSEITHTKNDGLHKSSSPRTEVFINHSRQDYGLHKSSAPRMIQAKLVINVDKRCTHHPRLSS